jgi:hypothetical protein
LCPGDLGKLLIRLQVIGFVSVEEAGRTDWDCAFYVPGNNPFRKKWEVDDRQVLIMIVTVANRCFKCVVCQRQVGDVASIFYSVNERYYCTKCGYKFAEAEHSIVSV